MISGLKKILDFYISGSVHVALSVYALIHITLLENQLPYDESVACFGFFGTIVGYNFVKYDELARVRKVVWHTQLKLVVLLSLISITFCGYYFFQLNRPTQYTAIGALLLTGFYTLPIVPKRTNIRNWSGVKIYIVALSWAIVTVMLPMQNSGNAMHSSLWMAFFQRFLMIFVLMLIFEIVDLSKDTLSLQTIPQQLGIKRTKWLGYVLLGIGFLLNRFDYFNIQLVVLQGLLSLLIAIAIFFAHPNRSTYYTSFWVEAIPVVWWLAYWAGFKSF